jgi:hypothetical protein
VHDRFDQLGKQVLRDFLVGLGDVETGAEVPAGNTQDIDVWYVPNPAHRDVLAGMTSELLHEIVMAPAVLEVFSEGPSVRAFDDCIRKQRQWRHALELRDKKAWDLPTLWAVCAGRPDAVMDGYGFAVPRNGAAGHDQAPAPAWAARVIVVAELPGTRATLLLRLLGSRPVRARAIAELIALPDDTWEKRLALPWLVRLKFELPVDASETPAEDEELPVETQEWFEQFKKQIRDDGQKEGRIEAFGDLLEDRLDRSLTETERRAVAERMDRLGEARVRRVLLALAPGDLAAWLADPSAT